VASSSQVIKYPFSRDAREASRRLANDIKSLTTLLEDPNNEYIIEEAESRVLAALDQDEVPLKSISDQREVLVYPTSRIIVEKIGVPRLREYQAEAESKAVNKHLANETIEFLISLAESSFGWRTESTGTISERSRLPATLRRFELRVRYEDYLDVAPGFHAPEWKLVNRSIDSGWVSITKSEFARLISGKFKQIILDGRLDVPTMPARLTEAVQRIESEVSTKIKKTEPIKFTEKVTSAFPPCIAQMQNDSSRGKNLPHEARFALAAFLLRIGMSEEEVLGVFRPAPDFARGLADYQVRHIASKESGQGYNPPGCRKMQINGICPVDIGEAFDPLCEYVLHPLSFYETRVWEISKNVTNHSWYASKRKRRQKFR
jgi:DNA primase large subunit